MRRGKAARSREISKTASIRLMYTGILSDSTASLLYSSGPLISPSPPRTPSPQLNTVPLLQNEK